MPIFTGILEIPQDEKKARKELARLQKNESRTFKATHKRTGFEGKTLWDKLNLFGTLAIPLIIALATIGFGLLQLHLADLQHQQDQQQALDQQRVTILQTYIDNIQDLLLNHNLLKSKPTDDVAILARARTLTALQGLDPQRKGRLLNFLYEVKLIGSKEITVPPYTVLSAIINLRGANLSYADLIGANLVSTDLSGASLSGANLNNAAFGEADNLTQQQLDHVDTCKGALLPKGLTCHHNQWGFSSSGTITNVKGIKPLVERK